MNIRGEKAMQQTEVSKWLKAITIAVGMMGILFFVFVVPVLAEECVISYPELAFLYWPGILFTGVTGIFCYAILFQFWKVCVEIGKDNSFSLENARSFTIISRLLVVLAELWFLILLALSVKRWMNLEIAMKMILMIFIWIAVAVLTAALSHLVRKAYEMKKENELTI